MKDKKFIDDYLERYKKAILGTNVSDTMIAAKTLLLKTQENGNKAIVVGNGGSAAMASHVSVDLTKQAGIRTMNFNEADLITCFANDYGYENWISKALDCYADPGDVLILISSSGQSKNMLVGVNKAQSLDIDIVTLTGFSNDNPLKKLGDINLWVDSNKYNIVEMTHNIWLLSAVDYFIMNNKHK